jgi:excinuclease ABC subunit C
MAILESVQAVMMEKVRDWPTGPGVYIMRDADKRILYVGKAKNLRNRIRSYFQAPAGLTPKTRVLVQKIVDVEFNVTGSELEALLLECNLIKKHRPRYNIRLKDDKNFPYVVLDFTHPFPQFRVTRKIFFSPHLSYFGPFSGGIRDISRFLLKTFQIRDCSEAKFKNRTRPCLNYEIGTCTGPCVGLVSQEDYAKQVREAVLFLKGKKQQLLAALKKEMQTYSDAMEFEKAKQIRDKIAGVARLQEKQDAVLVDKLRDIDVVGCFIAEHEIQWVVLFVRGGFLTGRRAEKVKITLNPEESIQAFLEQFYTVSLIPDEIWLTDDFSERENLQALLSQQVGKPVKMMVKRGEQALRLLGTAQENARLLYNEGKKKPASATEQLQEVLGLTDPPYTIEGIDVSNFQGQQAAVALVHFSDERPLKSRYRVYYPRTVEGANDFASIYEVVLRRFSKPDPPPPDLLMIDGGKGQLASAVKALKDCGSSVPVCSLAKARTESGFTRKEVTRSDERIFIPNRKNPIVLKQGSPALALLERVRDEAHRFSVFSHRRRRTNWSGSGNPLEAIEGVGEKTKIKLLKKFASVEGILKAGQKALIDEGIGPALAARILTELATAPSPKAPESNGTEE